MKTSPHDDRGGFGCLTADDSGIPSVTDEPGKRHTCTCGREWQIREIAGFVVWQPVGDRGADALFRFYGGR